MSAVLEGIADNPLYEWAEWAGLWTMDPEFADGVAVELAADLAFHEVFLGEIPVLVIFRD